MPVPDLQNVLTDLAMGNNLEEVRAEDRGGNETDVVLYLAGPFSDTYYAARGRLREALAEARKTKGREPSAADVEERQIDFLAELVVAWKGITVDGRPLPRTPKAARDLLANAPWIRDQVEARIEDPDGFWWRTARARRVLGLDQVDHML